MRYNIRVSIMICAAGNRSRTGSGRSILTGAGHYHSDRKADSNLRLANSMDKTHKSKLIDCRMAVREGQLVITTGYKGDLALESASFEQKAAFFEEIFGYVPGAEAEEESVKWLRKNDYVNRELSWIEFNYRVLSEARDKSTPLFDRLKFLSITASNLDEFYMVRVASLKDMVHAKYAKKDIAGLTAKEQLDKISEKTHQLVDLQYSTYNRSLIPALKQNGLLHRHGT